MDAELKSCVMIPRGFVSFHITHSTLIHCEYKMFDNCSFKIVLEMIREIHLHF